MIYHVTTISMLLAAVALAVINARRAAKLRKDLARERDMHRYWMRRSNHLNRSISSRKGWDTRRMEGSA